MISKLGWSGKFKIKAKNILSGKVEENIINNRITDNALDKIINILDNIDPDLNIKYLAIGTGGNPVNNSDTQLNNEIFRTQAQNSENIATGQFETKFTVLESEAVASWKEIGIFCGDDATSTANTGTMLSRILYNRDKTNLELIDITRVDKIERG